MNEARLEQLYSNHNIFNYFLNEENFKEVDKNTTSFKFKKELLEVISDLKNNSLAIEFGTHKAKTTRLLSFCFDRVITVDNRQDYKQVQKNNSDLKNVEYHNTDLYSNTFQSFLLTCLPENGKADLVFIDARHEKEFVEHDLFTANNVIGYDSLVVLDDYGTDDFGVMDAVSKAVSYGLYDIYKSIGSGPGTQFPNTSYKELIRHEGIVLTKGIKQ